MMALSPSQSCETKEGGGRRGIWTALLGVCRLPRREARKKGRREGSDRSSARRPERGRGRGRSLCGPSGIERKNSKSACSAERGSAQRKREEACCFPVHPERKEGKKERRLALGHQSAWPSRTAVMKKKGRRDLLL